MPTTIMMTSHTTPVPLAALPLVAGTLPSPVGLLRLVATDAALVGVYFPDHAPGPARDVLVAPSAPHHPVLDQAAAELTEYFAGRRARFTVPTAARGTPFQQRVWAALARIPFATTWSYGDLARAIDQPSAARAVGAANGRNPLSIIVPCHRVIGARGDRVGYAGGLVAKRWLLAHEDGRG